MKFLRLILFAFPFLFLQAAYAVNDYDPSDINTNTGTFDVIDDADKDASEKQLEMQKEEAPESEVDSFGQDEFNENVDPDSLDDNDNYNY